MNKYDVTIGQIVIIERESNPYEGFYGRVLKKEGIHSDGRDMVTVGLVLKEFDNDTPAEVVVEYDYEAIADDDGMWNASDFKSGVPTITDQFHSATEAFEEQCGGFPCEEEVMAVFDNGDVCRALRYVLDTQKFAYALCERIEYDNELRSR